MGVSCTPKCRNCKYGNCPLSTANSQLNIRTRLNWLTKVSNSKMVYGQQLILGSKILSIFLTNNLLRKSFWSGPRKDFSKIQSMQKCIKNKCRTCYTDSEVENLTKKACTTMGQYTISLIIRFKRRNLQELHAGLFLKRLHTVADIVEWLLGKKTRSFEQFDGHTDEV